MSAIVSSNAIRIKDDEYQKIERVKYKAIKKVKLYIDFVNWVLFQSILTLYIYKYRRDGLIKQRVYPCHIRRRNALELEKRMPLIKGTRKESNWTRT